VSPAVLLLATPPFAALTILALVQGLTEFLPVSSSGHLVLVQTALELAGPALRVDIALHVGTLLAVVVVYRRDLRALAADALAGRFRELLLLAVGTLPAAVVGLSFRHVIERAFEEPRLAAGGLLATACILVSGEVARRKNRRAAACAATVAGEGGRAFGVVDALVIGTAQALAIWPGVSRSGSTIAAGLWRGLSPARAARFSFLLSIPAILGAAVLSLPDALATEGGTGWLQLAWGGLFAGLVGWGALRALLAFLGRGAFTWFALYCGVLGAGALALGA
jgi:undecaprenyl-diphosphatase